MFGGTRGMVIKSLWGVLIAAVAVFSADRTLFFLSPYAKNWFDSPPVIVENLNRNSAQSMIADTLSWYHYSWDENSLPDSILVYSGRDSLFSEPVGFGGFPASSSMQIPIKMLFEVSFRGQGSIFYVPEESKWPDENSEFGFYVWDVRSETGYLASSKAFTLYFLVPDYKDWIEEIPVIVDAKDASARWKMTADGENPGWFRFQWNAGEYQPKGFYIYRESDSLLTSPIGRNGYALGRTALIAFEQNGADSLFLVTDLNYNCSEHHEEGIVYQTDIRKNCPLKKHCLEENFEPRCYTFNAEIFPTYYSFYSTDSVLVREEQLLEITGLCVLGEINWGCKPQIVVHGKSCDLPSGNYFIYFRDAVSDSAFYLPYVLEASAIPKSFLPNGIRVYAENSFVWIHSDVRKNFAVVNSLGQIVQRGSVWGDLKIKLPSSGSFWVKVESELFRVQIK